MVLEEGLHSTLFGFPCARMTLICVGQAMVMLSLLHSQLFYVKYYSCVCTERKRERERERESVCVCVCICVCVVVCIVVCVCVCVCMYVIKSEVDFPSGLRRISLL